MKTIVLTLILSFATLYCTNPVSGHVFGEPPFFKINGKYCDFYHVPPNTKTPFDIPQDSAPEHYLINTPIEFETDTQVLGLLPEVVEKIEFSWDFGDGTKGSGVKNTHTYTKPGSYLIKIMANYAKLGNTDEPQLFQSVLIHVLPHKDYKLPTAVIIANGIMPKDPLTDPIEVKTGSTIVFDGSKSNATESHFKTQQWIFADGETSTSIQTTHRYDKDLPIIFPLLRIVTTDGFIADAFVQINQKENGPVYKQPFVWNTLYAIMSIGGFIVIALLVVILRKMRYSIILYYVI